MPSSLWGRELKFKRQKEQADFSWNPPHLQIMFFFYLPNTFLKIYKDETTPKSIFITLTCWYMHAGEEKKYIEYMKLSQYFCYQQSILVPPSCRPYREPPPHQPCCTHHEKRTSYCLMSNRKSITIKDASAHAVVVEASQCNIDICSMTLGQVCHSLKPSLLCRVRPNQQSSRRRNPRAERKNPDLNHSVEATLLISTTLKV